METAVNWIVSLIGIYALIGLLVAVPFAFLGVQRIDPAAREGTWGFRLLIIPGAVLFWPLLLTRWVRGTPPPEEQSAHRRKARAPRS